MQVIEISGQEPLEQVQAELVEILAPLIAAWARQALDDGLLTIDQGMVKLAEDTRTDDKQV